MEQQQQGKGRTTRWDNPFAPGNSSRSQPASGRIAEHTTSVQSRYTNESASSILASFGLSNDDLEELSRYPDDQLTPENMPLILRDIRMHKMTRQLPSLPSQSREKETFSKDDGRGSVVKSKVIDYGHESKYGYTESPLDVKVYNSDVSTEKSMKGFQAQESAPVTATPSSIPSNTLSAVEELIRQMGFQRSTPNTQLFPPIDVNKVPGLCLSSAGPVVPPAVQPMMPPVVSTMPQPVMPPVAQQALPPPPVAQPMMPAMNQPPPPFVPEMLEAVNRHGRIQCESRGKLPNPPPRPTGSQKNFQKKSENPIESPFGVVKASWLPVFSQADAQKMKRLPTPSMMNDYYAASPRIFPHMCSLCNVECRHLKDWIQHQNSTAHIESCRRLCQQYPDWNPEALPSSERHEGDRKENHSVRRRSASPSPKRSRRSSSGHARRRTRSRSRSRSPGRLRAARPRSRSPRRLPSPRRRSRSPRRCQDSSLWSRKSCSRERGLGRSARSPDEALEAAVKCLGPSFVKQFNKQEFSKQFSKQEQFNKQKSFQVLGRETSGTKRPSPELGKAPGSVKKTPSNPVGPLKPSKMDLHSHSVSSKPVEAAETKESNQGGMGADGKNRKLPSGAPTKKTSVASPVPCNRLLTEKLLKCGTVLRISDLPDDGFSDYDIKKIVEPFGKVSDLLVLRSRNEAFLEMNYKEAAIAAVKYSNTVPVLVNGRRVKIGIAEKPRSSPSQNKGNGKKATKNVKKRPLNTKKDDTNSVEKMKKPAAPVTSTSKTNIKKPGAEGEPASAKKSGATQAAVEPEMSADAKKPEEAKKALESKKTTQPKKVVESSAKEMPRPAQETEKVPGATEAVKSPEAGESVKAEVTKKEVRKLEPTKEGHEGDQNENCTQRQRSISPSPEQVRCSSSGHARRLTRLPSRSPGRHPSAGRVRGSVASDAQVLPSPRHRTRSPQQSRNSSSRSQRSSSKESPRHRTRSPQQYRNSCSRSQRSSSKESPRHRTRSPQQYRNSCSRSQRSSSKESPRHRTRSPQQYRNSSSRSQRSSSKESPRHRTRSPQQYRNSSSRSQRSSSKESPRHRTRSPQQYRNSCSRSQRSSSKESPRHRTRSPQQYRNSCSRSQRSSSKERLSGRSSRTSGSSAEAQRSKQSTRRYNKTEKQRDKSAPKKKCHSKQQTKDEATSQEQPSSAVLQGGKQPHDDSKHMTLTPLAEKSVLQAMSLLQAGGASGVGPLAARNLDLAAVPPDVVSMIQLVATQVVQAVLTSKTSLRMQGRGDTAALGPGATTGVSSEAEEPEEKHKPLPGPEGVMVAAPGPEASAAGPGPRVTTSASSEVEEQELVTCSEGADAAAPGPEASAATLDSEANISVSSEAEKQELVPGPEGVNSDAPGPEAGISVSSEAEKQELVPSPEGADTAAPGPEASAATLDSEANISVSSEAEKQELVPSPVAAFQPKQLWICGHSGVQMARESAAKSGKGDQLGLSDQLHIKWLSRNGMEWNELVPMLEKEAATSDSPDVLVLQLGDNDLFKIDDDYLVTLAKKDLEWCLLRFPGVRILWSVLLPFPGWKSLIKYNLLNKRRRRVNNLVGSFLRSRGGNVILHPDITPKRSEAYSENGLCLSEKGADIWLRNICNGLVRLLQLSPPQGIKLRKRKQGVRTLPAEAPGTL